MIELQLTSADGTVDCVYRQWFLDVFLGPFSNVNDRIMPMSDAVSYEGPKTTGMGDIRGGSCPPLHIISHGISDVSAGPVVGGYYTVLNTLKRKQKIISFIFIENKCLSDAI